MLKASFHRVAGGHPAVDAALHAVDLLVLRRNGHAHAIDLARPAVATGLVALALIAALDGLVLLTLVLFARVRPRAALLLVPYLGWALFATVLNWQFLTLNPAADGQPDSGAVVRLQIGG